MPAAIFAGMQWFGKGGCGSHQRDGLQAKPGEEKKRAAQKEGTSDESRKKPSGEPDSAIPL